MIKLICSRCGHFADKIKWTVTSNRIVEDGIFKKEDLTGVASYYLLGHCPHCKCESEVKGGNWSWRMAGGRGWEELEDDKVHEYKF